jgi:hypothetical protein
MIELQIRYFPSEAHFEMSESLLNMIFAKLCWKGRFDIDRAIEGILDYYIQEEKQDDTRRTTC